MSGPERGGNRAQALTTNRLAKETSRMADKPHSAPDGAWNTQYANYLNLHERLLGAPAHQRDAIEEAIVEVQDNLLDRPAPSFAAVKQKLDMLWETELHGLDQASRERRQIGSASCRERVFQYV